ncbi:MAG: CoA-acylating methylmalonate-semialdehyde dehydrogenase [Polyangiaceae bacterium]|nr:CoA-acylating methylmalonate-semialdehyde dehydrogenase [Polyangiaceae bacterium]
MSEPRILSNFIGGAPAPVHDRPTLDVTSPRDGSLLARVPMCGRAEVDLAVAAAKRAQPAWAKTPMKERATRLFALRALLLAHLDELADTCAKESGKTVAEGRAEVLKGVEVVEFALSLQNLDHGASMQVSRGVTCELRREPLGVVAGIVPFNFPAMVPMWMFPIAIAVGNAFVMKPSEKVPITLCRVAELFAEAGLPPGIFSLVHGGADVAVALTEHPDVAAIGFVGSTAVARRVYELGTRHDKRVLALGGAKNHLLAVPDADPDITVQGVVDSFTGCAGQRCMAASVLVAVGDADALVARIVERARAIELGGGMGAIIDEASRARIVAAIAEAEADGAKVLLDGRAARPADPALAGGTWLGPTILDQVRPEQAIRHHEVFGPVLAIVRAPTLKDALRLQAESEYGNACSVFTTSGAVAEYVAEHATAGMIGVNIGVPVPREPFSFGGTKASKFGQGDITGESGVELWSNLKKITRKWEAQPDATWMG